MDRKSIWNYQQNKPSYIVRDIKEKYPEINEDFLYEVLLKRGVFKWFSVRRELIRVKNIWKDVLTNLMRIQQFNKTEKLTGMIKVLTKCRQRIRKLCHSDRWVAPESDEGAVKFLEMYEKRNRLEEFCTKWKENNV